MRRRNETGWFLVATLLGSVLFGRAAAAQEIKTTCSNVFQPGRVIVNEYWAVGPCSAAHTPVKGAVNTYVIEDISHMPRGSKVLICNLGFIPSGWTQKGQPFITQGQCAGWMMTITKPNMTYIGN